MTMKELFKRSPEPSILEKQVEKPIEKADGQRVATFWALFTSVFCHNPTTHIRIKTQPRKIFQTENYKNFRIDIEIPTCVHGFLAPDKQQPASLIIFAVQFVCLAKKGAFNRVKVDLDFESSNTSILSPNIVAHAPFVNEEEQNVSLKDIKHIVKKSITGSANITLGPGKAGASETSSSQREETFVQRYAGRAASSTRVNIKTGRSSGVWWNVKKTTDPNKSDNGINSNYCFAVLLERDDKSDFEVGLNLMVDAGWRFLAENGGSRETKIDGKSPHLKFVPGIWYEGNCLGIDRKKLDLFRDQDRLADLTKLR